jgi:RimJ/RimL family protein N-acetyltransferase
MTDHASPLGPLVDAAPARRPERVVLEGRFVDLEPLDAARHGESLWEATQGAGRDNLWTYLFDGPFASIEALRDNLARKSASADPLFWAIVDRTSRQALGHAGLMRIEPAHRVIEVGNILYAPALQRRPGATEAMALLARHIFDDLGYRRYEWKCNALNAPSRAAALRLGFSFEGSFRQHMIVKGRNRDTAWFAMLDADWPRMREAFALWLDTGNFDAEGRQRRSLAACRAAAAQV